LTRTFFDGFSGIGGFRLGMTRAGFQCVGYCEKDEHARKFYKKYFKPRKTEVVSHDITTIDLDSLPDFDCLTFGAPCQPFSNAGNRAGLADDRGRPLWDAIFALLRAKRPAMFLLEEVRGLLSVHGGRDFAWILMQFSTCGYDCEWHLLDWRSFNIPQARERLFVVGHYRGSSRSEVFPLRPEEAELYQPPQAKGRGGEGRGGADNPAPALIINDGVPAPSCGMTGRRQRLRRNISRKAPRRPPSSRDTTNAARPCRT